MSNGLSRLQTRFLGDPEAVTKAESVIGQSLDAERADELGLVTFIFDDIDWRARSGCSLRNAPASSPMR